MPQATSLHLRQQVSALHQGGHSPLQIAAQLPLPVRTIRDLCHAT